MNASTLWFMAIAMGVYQGVNPPTAWLHAVGRGLETRSLRAMLASTFSLALGHFLSMAAVLVPVAVGIALLMARHVVAMKFLIEAGWAMSGVLIFFGVYKILRPQHPRFIARIRPHQPLCWSFCMGVTHCGSPMMMMPVLLNLLMLTTWIGMCGSSPMAQALGAAPLALAISAAMSLPLFLTGSAIAITVLRRFGLGAVTRCWINLDLGWAAMFILMGLMGLAMRWPGEFSPPI